MHIKLNDRCLAVAERMIQSAETLRISVRQLAQGTCVIDAGVETTGGLQAGLELARLCMSDLAEIALVTGELAGQPWPYLQVSTDHPVLACLCSQYAGWQLSAGKYFGMGSGPMRSLAGREELFAKLNQRDSGEVAVGVIESSQIPTDEVAQIISEKCGILPSSLTLAVAPTASQAGSLQVVARSVETALHKVFELGFDVHRICSGWGTAPLPPVARNDLAGIGRTNDAILYGAHVILTVRGDDESIQSLGPDVPACSSPASGRTFLEIFEAAGRDFYQIDPHLFSPALITFQNLDTGSVMTFGRRDESLVGRSFGLENV